MKHTSTSTASVLAIAAMVVALGCQHAARPVLAASAKSGQLRIMTYNILNGGDTKTTGVVNRGEVLLRAIVQQKPDILALNECANWHRDNAAPLRKFETTLNMNAAMAIVHGLSVSVLVRPNFPILQVLTDTKRQAHALTIVTVMAPDGKPIKILATHMNPFKPDERMKEAAEIVRYIGEDERCVVLGDLNSLSARDNFQVADVPEDHRARFIVDGAVHAGVIATLEKAGLVDSYRFKHPEPKESDRTVGTVISTDKAHAGTKLRLDYILVTPNLTDAIQSVEVIQNDDTNHASDHFPVVLDLKL